MDLDENYDDVDIPSSNSSVEPSQVLYQQQQEQEQEQYQMQFQLTPPLSQTSNPMMAVHQQGMGQSAQNSSLFRPSPLSNLISQQHKQRSQTIIQSQQPANHFLPLGRGKVSVSPTSSVPGAPHFPPSSSSSVPCPSISPSEATQISESGMEIKFEEDKALLELLTQLESFTPIIPDPLMDLIMTRSGLETGDVKIKRLLALMAQKFITDVAQDAMQYSRIRSGGVFSAQSHHSTSASTKSDRKSKDKKFVLTLEDLNAALQDHGIVSRKPPYYR